MIDKLWMKCLHGSISEQACKTPLMCKITQLFDQKAAQNIFLDFG